MKKGQGSRRLGQNFELARAKRQSMPEAPISSSIWFRQIRRIYVGGGHKISTPRFRKLLKRDSRTEGRKTSVFHDDHAEIPTISRDSEAGEMALAKDSRKPGISNHTDQESVSDTYFSPCFHSVGIDFFANEISVLLMSVRRSTDGVAAHDERIGGGSTTFELAALVSARMVSIFSSIQVLSSLILCCCSSRLVFSPLSIVRT